MSKRLSNQIEAIEYVHALDGMPYRHDFKRGGTISLQKDGSVRIRNREKKLWDMFDVNGTEKPFLINPAGRRTTTTRGAPMAKKKRKMSAAQRKYFGPRKKNPSRTRTRTVTRYVTRKRNPAANPPKRRKHRRRRNPPMGLSLNGLLRRAQVGLVDAVLITGGRAGVRAISKQFPYPAGSVMDTVVEGLGALALGYAAERVLGTDRARFVFAGALQSSVEDVIASAGIPYISALLSATPNTSTQQIYGPADGGGRRLSAWQQLAAWQGGQPPLQRMGAVDSLPASTVSYLPA